MTFTELKRRVEAYDFGPYGRMVAKRIKEHSDMIEITYECETYDVRTWKPKTIPYQQIWHIADFTEAELQLFVESAWRAMWDHEMREFMTRDGTKVYQAH